MICYGYDYYPTTRKYGRYTWDDTVIEPEFNLENPGDYFETQEEADQEIARLNSNLVSFVGYDSTDDEFAIRSCSECKKAFMITKGEFEFFKSMNLKIPSHCHVCRNKKKKKKDADISM